MPNIQMLRYSDVQILKKLGCSGADDGLHAWIDEHQLFIMVLFHASDGEQTRSDI
jgi:hypothetical protein